MHEEIVALLRSNLLEPPVSISLLSKIEYYVTPKQKEKFCYNTTRDGLFSLQRTLERNFSSVAQAKVPHYKPVSHQGNLALSPIDPSHSVLLTGVCSGTSSESYTPFLLPEFEVSISVTTHNTISSSMGIEEETSQGSV